MALKDSTIMNIVLILGAIVSFVFSVLTIAFAGDIALYTMAVKNDIFWDSEYGYTDWNSTGETGTTQTIYKDQADVLEADALDSMESATSIVGIASSLIGLVLIALVFFRKDGGLIHMFKGVAE